MDSNIQKALWLGVGIMMFVAIVSTGLFLFNKGKTVAESSGEQLDAMSERLAMVEYQKFDNMTVSGSDLVNAIKEYKNESGDFVIVINTSYPSSSQYISTGTITDNVVSGELVPKTKAEIDVQLQGALDSGVSNYINPYGNFLTQLVYDGNEVVKGIVATQQ